MGGAADRETGCRNSELSLDLTCRTSSYYPKASFHGMPPATTNALDIKSLSRLWMQHMQAFSQPLVAFHQLAWRHHWLVWAPRAIIPSTIPGAKSRRRSPSAFQVTSLTAPVARQCFMYAHLSIEHVPDKRSRRIGNFAHARRIGLQCARPHQIKTPKTLIAIVVSPDRADSM